MKTIHKYVLNFNQKQSLFIPLNSEILTIQPQDVDETVQLSLWAIVNDESEALEKREFRIYGAGDEIENCSGRLKYINTFQFGGGLYKKLTGKPITMHIFEYKQ